METTTAERRAGKREQAGWYVRLYPHQALDKPRHRSKPIEAYLVDVCQGGARLLLPVGVERFGLLEMDLTCPSRKNPIVGQRYLVICQVAWCHPIPRKSVKNGSGVRDFEVEAGVRFISAARAVVDWIDQWIACNRKNGNGCNGVETPSPENGR